MQSMPVATRIDFALDSFSWAIKDCHNKLVYDLHEENYKYSY